MHKGVMETGGRYQPINQPDTINMGWSLDFNKIVNIFI